MADDNVKRIERDIEEMGRRISAIENASSPYAQQLLGEFRELQKRVADFSEQGTPHSRRELRYAAERLNELRSELNHKLGELTKEVDKKSDERDLQDLKEETRSYRTMVRAALLAALASIASGIILYIIQRATS